ncbi:hypothetical protein [Microbacterium gilvum]|uniref:Uncharacterized protein n=1 Tax=Microbacterium gilvum TaxID=1336204 RepID=A0ABP8ZU93_9MICO
MSAPHRPLLAVSCAAAFLVLSGCATTSPGAQVSAEPEPVFTTATTPTAFDTATPLTVIDDGDGAVLCTGGVAESLPPSCSGPLLVGWDWSSLEGDFEEASGVRWGDFVVAGVYDPQEETIVASSIVSEAEFEAE